MAALLESLSAADAPLWLDYTAYAGRLFGGSGAPWLDTTASVAWVRKAQGLLKSDVVALPIAVMVTAWLDANAGLVKAMTEKRRPTYPLKVLLADESLRAHLAALPRALRSGLAGVPLVLQMPSPRQWLAMACVQAHGSSEDFEIGADEIDTAAVLVADFLRQFGDTGIDGALLVESANDEPAHAEALAWYQPVFNVAAHYRWTVGVHLPRASAFTGGLASGIGFAIAPKTFGDAVIGLDTAAGFWSGEDAPALDGATFRHAEIPADAVPEQVLERLAALRAA